MPIPRYLRKELNPGQPAVDFLTVAEMSLQAILIFQDRKVVYANPASFELYGHAGEALLAMSVDELIAIVHPLDRAVADERVRKRLGGEQLTPTVELRIVRSDGSVRWIQAFNNPIEFRGRPAILSTGVDVSERKEAQNARRAAELRLQHVVASSPAILFTLPIQGGVVNGIDWMSDNVKSLLGYDAAETLGNDWWLQNVHPEDRAGILERFHADIFARSLSALEYRFRHRDGDYRWIRVEARLLRDPAGEPEEIVGSISDVTERRRLEDQFRQAQKMEAVGRLAGGVAHDFNNVMTVVSGYCQMMLGSLKAEDPNRAMVQQIQRAGEKAAKLTQQLLAYSRQTVMAPKVLDLNEVVREAEPILKRLIGEDVELCFVLGTDLGAVKVDSNHIGQVIMNLAVNARDAMPTGGRLAIETANVILKDMAGLGADAKPGEYVRLTVSDSGTGMPPEVRARIFEPFFTTKSKGKGTGLGLATIYGIVKQSNALIGVESEPGAGTTFKLYFPIVQARAAAANPRRSSTRVAGGVETILLVEDEDSVRAIVATGLRDAGYSVREARNGMHALELAGQHPAFDLLITDVVMPEMSGRQLVERLKVSRPALRILYLSGYTDDAIIRHGVMRAEVAFLQKPFTIPVLASKVRQVLDS